MDSHSLCTGYRYGKSIVPITEDDEKAMKFEAARCLSLMGFTNLENVKQHQCVGSSALVLTANPDDEVRVLLISTTSFFSLPA